MERSWTPGDQPTSHHQYSVLCPHLAGHHTAHLPGHLLTHLAGDRLALLLGHIAARL